MTTIEQIAVVAVTLGALVALWMLLKGAKGGTPARLIEEQLEVLRETVILLADDSVTIRKVVELTFVDAQVRLVSAADGKSAMELLEKEKFDVVIADVHMPAGTGYEVCEYAKKLHPEIPVLLLVGTFERFSEDLFRRCGADAVLKKPFNSPDLIRITSGLLQPQGGGSRAGP